MQASRLRAQRRHLKALTANSIMEENKDKRVLRVELDDEVKKVSITGTNGDEKVVMKQDLSEEDIDQATGGVTPGNVPRATTEICSIVLL